MLPRRLAALTLAAATFTAAAPAHACWDGLEAVTAGVYLQLMGDAVGTWDPARVQAFATWLARIDALSPDDLEIQAFTGEVFVHCDSCPENRKLRWDGELSSLFDRVATAVGADRKTRRQALAQDATAYTVQVASFADRADADRAAGRLNDREDSIDAHGFVQIGGFPSFNPAAHVVAADHDGTPVYRVVVGAFLSRADAATAQAEVHEQTGLRGFVRSLV